MLQRFICGFFIIMMGLTVGTAVSRAEGIGHVHLEPRTVIIDAFYNGAQVSVLGEVPRDAEVLVQLSGAGHDVELLKKGRVLGILWMNTGSIVFHHVPNVYKIYLPETIHESSLSVGDRWGNLDIGFNALKRKASLTPDSEDKDLQFKEFIKLKEHGKFYSVNENAITYQDADNQMKTFSCQLSIPSTLGKGTYTVETLIVKNGAILKRDRKPLEIKEEGLPAIISSLAFDHGALYGVLATIIALAAGLIMGVVFKGSQGGH